MNSTSQAVIAIRRPDDCFGRSQMSFIVRIDGRRAGEVKPGLALGGPTEFTVAPGEHTVIISIDGGPGWNWYRSRPCQLAVAPGSRTELVLRGRSDKIAWWKNVAWFLDPTSAAPVIAVMFSVVFTDKTSALVGANWWVNIGLYLVLFVLVFLIVYFGFVLVNSMFFTDYWVKWTLEPVGTTQAAPGTSLSDEAGMK